MEAGGSEPTPQAWADAFAVEDAADQAVRDLYANRDGLAAHRP